MVRVPFARSRILLLWHHRSVLRFPPLPAVPPEPPALDPHGKAQDMVEYVAFFFFFESNPRNLLW